MRPKSLLLLALALGCGLIASIGISQVMDKNDSVVGYETEAIYVAVVNINLNDPIDETMVSLQDWPKDKVPQGAVKSLDELQNRRPRTPIIQGEPILEAKLMAEGEVHDPIGNIPTGMRLKTISVDAEKSAAGLLSPGDRVDIQLFVNRNPGQGFPIARTKVILQNIRIYAVDQTVQRAADGGEGRSIAKTVSLLLTPDQANKVALAEQIGELNLIPRSPGDESLTTDTDISVDDLWGDNKDTINTRRAEQGPRPEQGDPGNGFLSGIMEQIKKAADERPPFTMTILEAEQVREVQFDPTTGKPLRGATGPVGTGPASVPARPSSTKVKGTSQDSPPGLEELEKEFGAEFPIPLE